jgi:hypothetical protein
MSTKQCRWIISIVAAVAGSAPVYGQYPGIPVEFQSTYPELQNDLNVFQLTLDSLWNRQTPMKLFSGGLPATDSNAGPALFDKNNPASIQEQLYAMQHAGANAATVVVSFPSLYQPYFDDPNGGLSTGNSAQQYIEFYQQVKAAIHGMGMKMIVESNVIFTDGLSQGWPNLPPYFASLGWPAIADARTAMIVTIAEQIQPDYLIVQTEPDTDAAMTRYPEFNDPTDDYGYITQTLAALTAANQASPFGMHSTVLIEAGQGSWDYWPLQQLLLNEAANPDLDGLDMHIYPINNLPHNNFLANALAIVQTVQASGKRMTISEAWMHKDNDNEFGVNKTSQASNRARSIYSFWAPLDQEFLQVLAKLGYYGNLDFITPFTDGQMEVYVNYYDVPGCPFTPPNGYPDTVCSAAQLTLQEQNAYATIAADYPKGAPPDSTGMVYQQLTLGNFYPEVTAGPAISPYPVADNTTPAMLSATAGDGMGGPDVSYLWAVTQTPAGASFPVIAAQASAWTPIVFSAPGTYTIQVTLTNSQNSQFSSVQTMWVNVNACPPGSPVLQTPAPQQTTVGSAFSYTIQASNSPTAFYAGGLPLGLSLNSATGVISGEPLQPGTYTVYLAAINAIGMGAAILQLTVYQAPDGTAIYRIDSGSAANYADPSGNVWSADAYIQGGYPLSTARPINGTTMQPLYQTADGGVLAYTIPVANGPYNVILKFAEIMYNGPGMRQFNVTINGNQVLTNFDIAQAAGGGYTAIDKSFPVTVTNGAIAIQFSKGALRDPLINAVEIATDPPPEPPVIDSVNAVPNPVVSGATTVLSVTATDPNQLALSYVWSAPPGATLSGSSAPGPTATFSAAGSYTFNVVVTNTQGLQASGSVMVVVDQALTSIAVSPSSVTLPVCGQQTFAASGVDQFGNPMAVTAAWSSTGGAITSQGVFTAGLTIGAATATATVGGLTSTASITLFDPAPAIVNPATAVPNPVTGTATSLSVLGSDLEGASTLTYTWTAAGPRPVTFSVNGSNAASKTTATFSGAGNYVLTATLTNLSGNTAASSTDVAVYQTLTSLTVTPSSVTLPVKGTQLFAAAGTDQFGMAMAVTPVWSASGGLINSTGLYTATAVGTYTVTAAVGSIGGTAAVTVKK